MTEASRLIEDMLVWVGEPYFDSKYNAGSPGGREASAYELCHDAVRKSGLMGAGSPLCLLPGPREGWW